MKTTGNDSAGAQSGRNEMDSRGMRIAIVQSTYHNDVCSALALGAVDAFASAGGDTDELIQVLAPGAYELVAISVALAERSDIDAVVALGCVLTGETSHDRYICDAVAKGLVDITVRTGKPIAFGVLTCLTIGQAQARAGGSKGNKGVEAMNAAIAAVRVIQEIKSGSRTHVGARR